MGAGDEAAVKAVFSRCLLTCLSVELWGAYLAFIKRVRAGGSGAGGQGAAGCRLAGLAAAAAAAGLLPLRACRAISAAPPVAALPHHSRYAPLPTQLNEPRGAAGLPEVRQALEFTLERLGQDSGSGRLWEEYVEFLRGPRPGTPEHAAIFGAAHEGQARRTAGRWEPGAAAVALGL